MVAAGLIVSRFLHFSAVLLLFGAAAFPLYAYREGERGARTDALFDQLRRYLIPAAVLALLSAISWLCLTSANMSGSLANAVNPAILAIVIRETDFGKIWIWRIALSAVLVVLFWPKRRSEVLALAQIAGAALLLTSIAGTGHAGADATPWGTFHVAADSLHLLAASAWLGGLLPLAIVLAHPSPDIPGSVDVLNRFSGMGTLAVAALVLSGIINSLFQVGSIEIFVTSLYGRILIVKLGLFAVMLRYAAANRFNLVPALAKAPGEPGAALARLRKHVAIEQVLGVFVLGVVAFLGTLAPGEG
jgi:putative copper resistance protein D